MDYAAIAEAIAQRGAVVVSANWGPTREPAELIPTVASAQTSTSEIGGAIAFAASHASDYGADPTRVVVVGHSGGANAVSPAVLGRSAPFGGCAADESWSASGLVLWEGDMLVEDPAVYEVGPDTPAALMAAFTPWGFLDNGYAGQVVFAVSDTTAKDTSFQRCDGTDFLTARDPTGWIQRVLDSQRALHDGCVDVREESRVIGAALADHGVDVAMLDLIDPATSHYELGPADLQRFAAAVLEMVS